MTDIMRDLLTTTVPPETRSVHKIFVDAADGLDKTADGYGQMAADTDDQKVRRYWLAEADRVRSSAEWYRNHAQYFEGESTDG